MMKAKRIAPVMRGLSAVMASVLALSVVGTGIAESYRSALDGFLGTSSYVTLTDEDSARFQSDYATIDEMKAAAKNIAIKEGEEGTVIMKNDNDVLPLASDTTVALFGLAALRTLSLHQRRPQGRQRRRGGPGPGPHRCWRED